MGRLGNNMGWQLTPQRGKDIERKRGEKTPKKKTKENTRQEEEM
jgi:hypothetical protein